MTHYIAILIPSNDGSWRVVFPDLPGCEARGINLDEARFAAATAAARHAQANGSSPPQPRDLSAIERDDAWLSQHRLDLSQVIVTMVALDF